MKNYTKEQLKKLPKWAKNKILTLESNNQVLESRLDCYEGKEMTNTVIRNGLERSFLPKNSVVEFLTGRENLNKVTVYIRHDGFIDVNTDSRIGEEMILQPRAANSFQISFINK